MTNGDKLLSIFDEALIYGTYKEKNRIEVCIDNSYINVFDLDWWNSEYRESKAENEEAEKVKIKSTKDLINSIAGFDVSGIKPLPEYKAEKGGINKMKEIGCTQCPYAGHIELKECPDAYTEVSQHCGLYNHEPIKQKVKEINNETDN